MTKVLGIIGGGQLGMMIAEAAKDMGDQISKIIVLFLVCCINILLFLLKLLFIYYYK